MTFGEKKYHNCQNDDCGKPKTNENEQKISTMLQLFCRK